MIILGRDRHGHERHINNSSFTVRWVSVVPHTPSKLAGSSAYTTPWGTAVSASRGPFLTASRGKQALQSLFSRKELNFFPVLDALGWYPIWALAQCYSREITAGPRDDGSVSTPQPSVSTAQAFLFSVFSQRNARNWQPGTFLSRGRANRREARVSRWGCRHTSWRHAWTCAEGCFQSDERQTGIWLFGLESSWIQSWWSLLKIQLPMQCLFPLPNVQR